MLSELSYVAPLMTRAANIDYKVEVEKLYGGFVITHCYFRMLQLYCTLNDCLNLAFLNAFLVYCHFLRGNLNLISTRQKL